jgi:hypothetical protein
VKRNSDIPLHALTIGRLRATRHDVLGERLVTVGRPDCHLDAIRMQHFEGILEEDLSEASVKAHLHRNFELPKSMRPRNSVREKGTSLSISAKPCFLYSQ